MFLKMYNDTFYNKVDFSPTVKKHHSTLEMDTFQVKLLLSDLVC